MNLLLHVRDAVRDEWLRALARELPGAQVHAAPATTACDYALVWKPTAATFAGQRRLRAVFNLGAGVDAVLASGALPADVPLVRLEDAGMATQMVEYVVWGVLGHYRQFDVYDAQAARRLWQPLPARYPRDFTVGVAGVGVLGQAMLAGLRPFGFRLAGWSRTPRSIDGVHGHHGSAQFGEFLAGCDVVVCIVPLTEATRGLFGADAFARMRRGSCLINVARGEIVDEDALLDALDSGHLAGALLDVFHDEPLPDAHPFWRHPRVRVTPHVSAATLIGESVAQVAAKIRRLEQGEPIGGIIDRSRQY